MESMRRQLSTSLPGQHNEADLLAEFKAAALSVTNLYKTAATSQKRTRAAGYQDALEELLACMDRENIGVMDGEGWRIRKWITERLDADVNGSRPQGAHGNNLTDDEDGNSTSREEDRREDRSSSPEKQKISVTNLPTPADAAGHDTARQRRVLSESPQPQIQPNNSSPAPSTQDFTFRSAQPYPSSHGREANSNVMDTDRTNPSTNPIFTNVPTISAVDNVRIVSRAPRSSRLSALNRRNDNRSSTLNVNLGAGAGNKRKIPYPDFFDITGFPDGSDRKDGFGKRGRHA